ncbi:MAG TPA: addiction module protein [Gemmataceae bacterium]|nr:addiction module protein [Gemmataceae bacterium]
MDLATLLHQIRALPDSQKRIILDALHDDLSEDSGAFVPPEYHRELLAERVRERDADPTRGEPWDVVRRRLGWDS